MLINRTSLKIFNVAIKIQKVTGTFWGRPVGGIIVVGVGFGAVDPCGVTGGVECLKLIEHPELRCGQIAAQPARCQGLLAGFVGQTKRGVFVARTFVGKGFVFLRPFSGRDLLQILLYLFCLCAGSYKINAIRWASKRIATVLHIGTQHRGNARSDGPWRGRGRGGVKNQFLTRQHGRIRKLSPALAVHVELQSDANLLEIGFAGDAAARLPGRLDGGHQESHEDADDGNHDEQFDERHT